MQRNLGAGFDRAQKAADKSAVAMERSFSRVADATGRVRIEQERYDALVRSGETDRVKLIQQSERLATARRAELSATRSAGQAHRDHAENLRKLQSNSQGLLGTLIEVGQGIAALGRVGGPVVIATAAVGLTQLAGAAAMAAQSLWLLPGAIGAIGAAFGTIKLATVGLDDAFSNMGDPEKFAESLRELAPSAQQFMLSIQNMMPALTNLKNATQDAFFDGVGPQLNQLANAFLPAIQQMTTGVASAFNQMFAGVTSQLMTPGTSGAIQEFLNNVAASFQQLAPAAAPLTQALADIMAVGSGVLPQLATAAAQAAQSFATFIAEARASGDLQRWLSQGLEALNMIGQIAWDVGRAFMALAPVGAELLPTLVDGFNTLAEIMPVLVEGGGLLVDVFRLMSGDMSALPDLFSRIGEWGVAAFNRVRDALNRMFDPVREGIELFNKIPGVADIPQIPDFGGGSGGNAGGFSGGGGSFAPPAGATAGIPGAPPGGFGLPSGRPGDWWNGAAGHLTSGFDPGEQYRRDLQERTAAAGTGGGGRGAKTPEGLTPNAAQLQRVLQQMFPGVQVNADVGRRDSFGEHSSGEALDIMVGNNRMLGDQLNRWLLQNSEAFGLQYNLWRQAQWDPSGEIRPMADRGSPTQNHMDHIHARVRPGEPASGNYMPLGAHPYQSGVQNVAVESFGSSAQSDLSGIGGQLGAQLDQDFGISKGLPGLAENAVKFVGNLFFAPLLTALQALAGGRPDEGSGLIGMMAAAGGYGSGGAAHGMRMGAAPGPLMFGGPSAMGPAALQPPWSADWNAIAQKESSGNWGINTGNGYSGGLQFSPSSWEAAGGTQYAPAAHLATPFQQAMTAENLLKMQGPGAWPNTFVPGSSGPAGPGAPGGPGILGLPFGGGGSMLPGTGMPGAAPLSTGGMAYPTAGGGGFQGLGGMPMDALMMATSGLDALAPGAGAAAKIGIQLANRTVAYLGQVAGIGVSGLMETLSLGDNPMGSLGKSWFGRLAGGFAGARPALPNTAGQAAPATPSSKDPRAAAQQGLAAMKGGDTNITVNNNRPTEDGTGRDIAWHVYSPAGRQG
ncbi:transglycosylase family protein [Mycobacterium sp. NAZ190054]|uniref:transglycosylase family protein n=1 Tax=Mycobacterium sp. NAZ190054 TaxID=1747766 RepID=UPI0026F415D1|nr:transglycosylase family protein [Mycobacterium sp. NAZ190054]